jgi:hypothetical protein
MTVDTADTFEALKRYLQDLAPGRLEDTRQVVHLLSLCWDDLPGSGAEATESKHLERMERASWQPPRFSFLIERHGGTVSGSTRAELHRWIIDVDRRTADCNPDHSYRQVLERDSPLRVGPIVSEIVERILTGTEDSRLKWSKDRQSVRVLVREFIKGEFKQTQEGRRRRFRNDLDAALRARGWEEVSGKLDRYRPMIGGSD